MIYLDNAATTRPLPCAADAALRAMTEDYWNPAAAYSPAVEAARKVRSARERLASAMGAGREEVFFTSCATESNNTAILGALRKIRGKKRILTTLAEHPSVYEVFRSLESDPDTEVVYLETAADGSASMDALRDALNPDTVLVSLMHVNNETGSVTDLEAASALIRKLAPKAAFHADGVQAFCKVPFTRLPCDLYSVSGHKFYAPKGIGALLVRSRAPFHPLLLGGGQEDGRRSGTLNMPGILAMDAALSMCQEHREEWSARMRALKLRLAGALLSLEDVAVNGPAPESGADHILNLSFLGVRGEVLRNALSEKGVCVSTGSACASKKKNQSRVLAAMHIPPARQDSAIRFSLNPFLTEAEIDDACTEVASQVAFLRKYKRR